jgi:hypothetical protein
MRSWRATITALLGLALFTPAHAATFSNFDSGNFGELLTSSPGDDAYRVLYSVDVGSLAKGDILVVKCDAELTNHGSTNVGLASQLRLGTSVSDLGGVELDEANQFLVPPIMLHGVPYKHAIYEVKTNTTSHFVNFLVASTGTMAVEQDYGRLQVLVIHP